MTAAVALAVVLVIAVAGMSLAMQTQQRPAGRAPGRPTRAPGPARRVRERRPSAPPAPQPPPPPADPEPEWKGPELLRTGASADAKVISVVDERTLGPVTRSRLVLSIQPAEGESFEATIRTAFATPAARATVKVGGTVRVRYDRENHDRVVLDPSVGPGGEGTTA